MAEVAGTPFGSHEDGAGDLERQHGYAGAEDWCQHGCAGGRSATTVCAPEEDAPRVHFQGLDLSVVTAATSAGVSSKVLEQMEMT